MNTGEYSLECTKKMNIELGLIGMIFQNKLFACPGIILENYPAGR